MEHLTKPDTFIIYSNLGATCMENGIDAGYYYYQMVCLIGNSGWVTRKDFIHFGQEWFGKSRQHLSRMIKKYDGEFWTYYPKYKTLFYKGTKALCQQFMVKGTSGDKVEYDIEYLSSLKKFRSAILDSQFAKKTYKQDHNPNSNNHTGKQISKVALRKKLGVRSNKTLRGYEKLAHIIVTVNRSRVKIVEGSTGECIVHGGRVHREDARGQYQQRINGNVWLITQLPNSYYSQLGTYIPSRPKYNSGDNMQSVTGQIYFDTWKQVENKAKKVDFPITGVYVRSKAKLRSKNTKFGDAVYDHVFF